MKCLLLAALVLSGASVNAESLLEAFGNGASQFQIEFVAIGNPNNAADDNGFGSVENAYNLGKYEISRDMIEKANSAGGLEITMAELSLFGGNGVNRPASGINWFEAAKFVNYLNTSRGKQAAYKIDSSGNFQLWGAGQFFANNPFRHKDAYFFLPTRDEWYKGAYGSPSGTWYNYPTGSDSLPAAVSGGTDAETAVYGRTNSHPADITNAGGLSAYGTMAQAGNVWEWNETALDGTNDLVDEDRSLHGGAWSDDPSFTFLASNMFFRNSPSYGDTYMGFRVAMVPEPSALSLFAVGLGVLLRRRRRTV